MQCIYCFKEFKRKNSQTACSLKCRLLKNIKKEGECWIWQGVIAYNGYGRILHKKKQILVHRMSYKTFVGDIPQGMIVCHNCPGGDNKSCINPSHLWLGTYQDNMVDASKKGKMKGMQKWTPEMYEKMKDRLKTWKRPDNRGEKSARSKLKDTDIYEIRNLLKQGLTHKEIGEKFCVSKHTIGNINLNRRWSHI